MKINLFLYLGSKEGTTTLDELLNSEVETDRSAYSSVPTTTSHQRSIDEKQEALAMGSKSESPLQSEIGIEKAPNAYQCVICPSVMTLASNLRKHYCQVHFLDQLLAENGSRDHCVKCPGKLFRCARHVAAHVGAVHAFVDKHIELAEARSQRTLHKCPFDETCAFATRQKRHVVYLHLAARHFRKELRERMEELRKLNFEGHEDEMVTCPVKGCMRVLASEAGLVSHFGIIHGHVDDLLPPDKRLKMIINDNRRGGGRRIRSKTKAVTVQNIDKKSLNNKKWECKICGNPVNHLRNHYVYVHFKEELRKAIKDFSICEFCGFKSKLVNDGKRNNMFLHYSQMHEPWKLKTMLNKALDYNQDNADTGTAAAVEDCSARIRIVSPQQLNMASIQQDTNEQETVTDQALVLGDQIEVKDNIALLTASSQASNELGLSVGEARTVAFVRNHNSKKMDAYCVRAIKAEPTDESCSVHGEGKSCEKEQESILRYSITEFFKKIFN